MLGNEAVPDQPATDDESRRRTGGRAAAGTSLPLSERVRGLVSEERFAHIERVAALAVAIAAANDLSPADRERVALAALLHDAARDLSDERLLELVTPENRVEMTHPLALHGRAARRLAESWGVTDEVVLRAVEGHVFGVAPDDLVGVALYVADVSEPARGVNADIRELAMSDLAAAYRLAVNAKVNYLKENGIEVHPTTIAVHRSLQPGAMNQAPLAPPPGSTEPEAR